MLFSPISGTQVAPVGPPAGKDTPSKSAERGCNVQVLAQGADGSRVEAKIFSGGSIVAEVVSKSCSGSCRPLGQLKAMVDGNGFETLQARCRVHSKCICWVSNSKHSDLMLQWLSRGEQETVEQHQSSAKELKKSVGMKVRG